jgi:hypothetical protein
VRAYCEANLTGYKRPKIVEFREPSCPRRRAWARSCAASCGLSDEEFAEVLAFTKTAFDMAVRFRFAGSARARPAAKGRGE